MKARPSLCLGLLAAEEYEHVLNFLRIIFLSFVEFEKISDSQS